MAGSGSPRVVYDIDSAISRLHATVQRPGLRAVFGFPQNAPLRAPAPDLKETPPLAAEILPSADAIDTSPVDAVWLPPLTSDTEPPDELPHHIPCWQFS